MRLIITKFIIAVVMLVCAVGYVENIDKKQMKYEIKMMKIKVLEDKRDFERADQIYKEILDEYTDDTTQIAVTTTRAYYKYLRGDYVGCRDEYETVMKKHENYFKLNKEARDGSNVYLGYSYILGTGEYEKAEKIFQGMLEESNFQNYNIWYSLGEVYYYKGDCKKAVETFEKAIQVYKSIYGEDDPYGFVPMTLYHAGLSCEYRDRKVAKKQYSKLINLIEDTVNDDNFEKYYLYYFHVSRYFFSGGGEKNKSLNILKSLERRLNLLRNIEDFKKKQVRDRINYELGIYYNILKKYDISIGCLENVFDKTYMVYWYLGENYFQKNILQKAKENYEIILDKNVEDKAILECVVNRIEYINKVLGK